MKQIKFSHKYDKMVNNYYNLIPKTAFLMEVFIVSSNELYKDFIEYDTMYFNGEKCRFEYYELPKGKVLILFLKSSISNETMIWTTIRRFTEQKYKYYNKARGEEFEIVIEAEK
jgi:hypothetical protein